MAQKVMYVLISDLDGGPADETVRFGIEGTSYEIDLSAGDAAALRKAFQQYVKAGRKVPAVASGRGKARSVSAAGTGREATRKIREWAMENGYNVSARGRISSEIAHAYQKAGA
jgi:Lsr2